MRRRPLTRFRARAARKLAEKILWERRWYASRVAVAAAAHTERARWEHRVVQGAFERALRKEFGIPDTAEIRVRFCHRDKDHE